MRMKIGILGGTFDPIHRGHLALARHALKQFKLDKVLFIPAARPPHKKSSRPAASAKHRLAMTRLAVGRSARFRVSELEMKRKGPSYTIDTLKTLRKKFPEAALFLILGQDAYEGLKQWKEPAAIERLAHFIVAKRPGCRLMKKNGAKIFRLRMPLCPASSSGVRSRVKNGQKWDDDLPRTVVRYIESHHLYGYRP